SPRQTAMTSMQPYLNAYPRPNGRDLANNFSEFNATYSDPSSLDATSIRIDHTVNSRLTLFGRYNYAPSKTSQRGAGGFSLNTNGDTKIRTQTLTGGATLAVTPTMSNDFRANYSRNVGRFVFSMDDFGGAVPLSPASLFPPSVSSQDSFF